MINTYFDLDDTVFDFSHDFLDFVNNRYGKITHVIPDNPEKSNEEILFGVDRKKFLFLLALYIEAGRFAIQPLIKGAKETLAQMAKHNAKPNFITVRGPESRLHSAARLQDVYYKIGVKHPYTAFRLAFAESKHYKKWHIIQELSRYSPKGIFVDDYIPYVNDVVKHCPGIVAIYMNTLNIKNSDDCHAHYKVKNWSEYNDLIFGQSYEDLLANSAHPGVQKRLAI